MDKGHLVGMVLLDLQKALDTVKNAIKSVQNTIPSTSGQLFDCSQITYEITLLPS